MSGKDRDITWSSLRAYLHQYLQRHAGHIKAHHEDIVHDALIDLMRRESSVDNTDPPSFDSNKTLRMSAIAARKLGVTILKRRMIDHLRRSREPLFSDLQIDVEKLHATGPLESQVAYQLLLAACVRRLSSFSKVDRAVVTKYLIDSDASQLSMQDRTRMSRLRKKLKAEIERDLNMSLTQLLSSSEPEKAE
ncbi:MAG: RNA polymerase sigma factor [Gammaproteobacteria bacterium]